MNKKFQQIIFALNRIIQGLISEEYTLFNIIPKSLVTLQFLMLQIKAYIQGFQMRYISIIFVLLVFKQLQLIFWFYGYLICSDNHGSCINHTGSFQSDILVYISTTIRNFEANDTASPRIVWSLGQMGIILKSGAKKIGHYVLPYCNSKTIKLRIKFYSKRSNWLV